MENNNIDDKWLIVYQGYLAQYKNDYAKDSYNDKLVLVTGDKKSVSIDARKSYLCVANEENSIEIPIPDLWIEKIQIGNDTRSWTTRVLNLAKENGINISFGDDGKTVTIGIDKDTRDKIDSIDNKVEQTEYDAKVTELEASIGGKYTKPVGGIPAKDLAAEVATETEVVNAISKAAADLNDKIDSKVGKTDLKDLKYTINGTSSTYNGLSEATIPQIFTPTQTGSQGQVLQSMGGGAPQWANLSDIKGAVGFAKDLTGVLEATPEEFTFRPSAGDKSIRDESAVIRRIKGNTVVFAQLSKHTDTLQREDDWSVAPEVTTNTWGVFSTPVQVIANHKYLFYINKKDGRSITDTYTLLKGAYRVDFDTPLFITSTETASWTWTARYQTSTNGLRFQTQAFDLTNLFGAGNEPTTLEEFKGSYPDIYPYCDPEIRNMRAWGIETVSANAFNKDEVSDGALHVNGTISSYPDHSVATIEVVSGNRYSLHNIANIRYNYALYDSNYKLLSVGGIEGTITNLATTGDIDIPNDARYMRVVVHNDYLDSCCVNLRHSGTFGNDTTYFRKVRELPEIANYFPDGMNSVGEVYDEINAENAIQRCGVRAYEDGDENNPNVMTDRTNTVYQLDEPIVTPITEPLQLDYDVADFGTEKALTVPKSSPFRADIVYQFNAEGRIRDNSRNIERIEAQTRDFATRDFVYKIMPTEIATATQLHQFTSLDEVEAILPNIMYEYASGLGQNATVTLPLLAQQGGAYDHVWMLRLPSIANSNSLQYTYAIKWKDGTPPTFVTACTLEIYLKKIGSSEIIGEWKIYR